MILMDVLGYCKGDVPGLCDYPEIVALKEKYSASLLQRARDLQFV
jgi:hypothetical protein